MATLFTNAVDITPATTGVWVDVDVSAYVPAGATGVIVQIENPHPTTNLNYGLRKKGSTDARNSSTGTLNQTWGYIGVDANRTLQGYVQSYGGYTVQLRLLGYTTTDATFFTDAYNKTPGTTGWNNVDCSAEIPAGAKFALVEMLNPDPSSVGLRYNGSTDSRLNTEQHTFAIVGLDVNRIFQFYRASISIRLYLVGYMTAGVSKTNGADVSLGVTGTYQTIDRSADPDSSGTSAVIVEVVSASAQNFALRKNGSTDDYYKYANKHVWATIGLDGNKIFEGKIASTEVDFYILGYLKVPAQTFTYTTDLSLSLSLQSVYGLVQTFTYLTNMAFSLSLQSIYSFPQVFNYIANMSFGLSLNSVYSRVWNYVSSFQVSLLPQSTYFKGWEKVVTLLLNLIPQSDYFGVLGRGAIPGPYILRYPNPRNGQTNVPVGNPIKFIIKSDGPGINIDTVKVKVTDSQGVNTYDSTSPYFKYSGKKSRYEVEVRPPQPWAYEENAQVEIDAWDLAVPPVQGVVYEYVP